MARDIPALRILPMSGQIRGFCGRSIEDVQAGLFLCDLPRCNGRWRYASAGLNTPAGSVVLFQFRARIIASAVFLRDERFERPIRGHHGAMHFDPRSIRTFDPIDAEAMRVIWPGFRGFGHVKQYLNPTRYGQFARRLKHVKTPVV